jgi:hypothetical protein
MVIEPARPSPGYDAYTVIGREVWVSAADMIAGSNAPAARRRARRHAHREALRGDYFSARTWFRTAKAIEWLSSLKRPRHMRLQ